jgi:hypothetical protein
MKFFKKHCIALDKIIIIIIIIIIEMLQNKDL